MDIADRLLEAHVAHQIARLRGDVFAQTVADEVDYALSRAGELTLDEVMHRDQIKAVAWKYVGHVDVPGAIPAIVGDIASRLRSHPAHEVTLGEVVQRRHVVALVEKVSELPAVRQAIATRIADNPSVQAWLAQYLYSLATGTIATNRRLASKLPGVSTAFSMGEKLAGGAIREADQRSRELAEKTAVGILQRWRSGMAESLADEEFAQALLSLWDQVAERRMRDVLDATEDDDLVDFVVLGYELWQDVRGADYLRSLIDTGVDYFFDTYGEFALDELLVEFGLGRDDLIEEALRFAPRVIDALVGSGLLEDLLRRQFAAFYASPEAAEILAERARPRPGSG